MRLDKKTFEELDGKIKDHKTRRAKELEKATIIRTDILNKKNSNLSTLGITDRNDEIDEEIEEEMIEAGVLKKK